MGKKKSKGKKKNDARGYGQTPRNQVAPSKSITSKPSSVSTKDHANLQILLKSDGDSASQAQPAATWDTSSKRFYRKIENLHDQLIDCGFSEEQVETVVLGLGSSSQVSSNVFSVETALDWLCLHLPTEELPPIFTEGIVRDTINEVTTTVEVLDPVSQKKAGEKIQFDPSTDVAAAPNKETKSSSDKDEDAVGNTQKSWILSHYQYEDEEEPQNEVVADKGGPVGPEDTHENLTGEELRLQQLEQEVEEFRATLNDDVANYMRSKHEIKELKKDFSKLQGELKKLRAKVEKSRRKRALEKEVQPAEDACEAGADDDLDGGGLFGMFEEADTPAADKETQAQDPDTSTGAVDEDETPNPIQSSEPSVPKDWTGTTPVKVLGEWCRKAKLPRPTYQIPHGNRRGGGIAIKGSHKSGGPVNIEQPGPFFDFEDAKQFLATEALFRLSPTQPLYRLFPPVFRELWKSWLAATAEAKEAKKGAERVDKQQRIAKLIDLIPTQVRTENDVVQKTEEEPGNTEVVLGDWEDNSDPEVDKKPEKPSNEGLRLQSEFEKRQSLPQAVSMRESREKLPVHSYREQLLQMIANNKATVLCAETGAGKTTQCPQFLLEDALLSGRADKVSILCTQPRRISAMSVAERVADEMCDSLGGLVGYSIRMESKRSKRTKLLFCTTGVVLRRLQDDPTLEGVTHCIIDEVHERQWQIDFLLIALRRLLGSKRPDLKVILMSATLDAKLFCSFFNGAPLLTVPGRTFPVAEYFLEDLLDATDHIIEEDSRYAVRSSRSDATETLYVTGRGGEKSREVVALESAVDITEVSGTYEGYKLATQRSMDRVDESVINYDLIEDVLSLLLVGNNKVLVPPEGTDSLSGGSVLVFLPGMGEIRALSDRLMGSRLFGNKNRFIIMPLHSTLSPQDQKAVFRRVQPGCYKIILATNIAETSVTIPDVVCVIDSGLVREVRQDRRYATSRLVLDWCSRASAKQRAGRAGRVQPGICCRLFSSQTASRLKTQADPELRRIPLEEACLTILAGKLAESCMGFLQEAPQAPPEDAVRVALDFLVEVGAVTVEGVREKLTPLGFHLSRIPMQVKLAKMLIFAVLFKCLDPILTITAGLSSKSPFLSSFVDSTEAKARHKVFQHEFSDFMTLCNVWEAFSVERVASKDRGRKFCNKNLLNWNALSDIGDMRRQSLELVAQIGFVQANLKDNDVQKSPYNKNGRNLDVIHAVVCAGLYPNVARAVKGRSDEPPSLSHRQEQIFFHSSSVNYQRQSLPGDWIVFHEKFATRRTMVSATSPVHMFALILFGGDVVVKHLLREVVVDEWITLPVAAQSGVMFRELRKKLDSLLETMIGQVDVTEGKEMVDGIVKLLS